MSRVLLTGNSAAAWGARLAQVDYIPAFPITPQTEIIESLAAWCDRGEMNARLVTLESEHSMICAAGAAAATGVRVFTATSSQGLLYAMEMLYTVAGWRVPFVLVNVSRGLSAPITLEPDHNDILAARDSGFLQIHCATCQEILDNILIAYRLAEHPQVRLPVIVNLDGFYLSFTREPVEIPDNTEAAAFVGEYQAQNSLFRASSPSSQGVAVLGGSVYSYFRYQSHMASLGAAALYHDIAAQFAQRFQRQYTALECYRTQDAEIMFIMMGAFATKAMDAVDRLRDNGIAVGLLRPRLLRPFAREQLIQALKNVKGLAVIDQNISLGSGGVLHTEVCSALYGAQPPLPLITSYIGGLGGRDISIEEFYEIARELRKAVKEKRSPAPRLLYTEQELRQVRNLQAIAEAQQKQRNNLV